MAELQGAFGDPDVQAVLVAGEAGIGKTRLVGEFCARMDLATMVLTGPCPEFGNDGVAFGPFIAIMRGLLRREGAARLAELLPAQPALARWLPELAAATGPVEAEPDRTRLLGEVLTLVEQLSASQSLVLVLEDLHWADDSSLDLLAFLIANLTYCDALIVGTYRPPGSSQLRNMVAELRRRPGVRQLSPQPFTRYEVGRQLAALLGREPEPGFIGRVFERSAGNPLFVEALSQSSNDTPADLNELLLVRLSRLSDGAKAVLRVAAVAGSPADHQLLAAAADMPEPLLHDALRELVAAQLLLAGDRGYEFRHILIRQAVYQDLLPMQRTGLHARLAAVLVTEPGLLPREIHSAELAHHAYAARQWRPALEASWQAAAIAADAGARPEQLRHLERVLELWDRVPDAAESLPVDRRTLLEQTVEVCSHQGVVERGLRLVDEALLMGGSKCPERAGKLLFLRARLRNQAGGGRDDLLRALHMLPVEPPTLLRGQVLAELASTRVFSGDSAGAAEDARAAIAVAERLSGPQAASLHALAHAFLGLASAADTEVAVEHFATAHALSRDPDTLLNIVIWESAVLVAAGEYSAAIEVIQQGLRAAHETFRFVEKGPILIVKWVQALIALGRWSEALNLIDESLTDEIPPLSRAVLMLCHAKIMLAQGDLVAAQSGTDAAEPLLGQLGWAGQYRLELKAIQFRLATAHDSKHEATQLLADASTGDNLTAHHHEVWPLLVLAADIPVFPVDLAAAADALPRTTRIDTANWATFTAAQSRQPSAWHQAARAWESLHQPLEQAHALVEAAQVELAGGLRAQAKTTLLTAVAIARDLGALPLLHHAEQAARRAGFNIASPSTNEPTARLHDTDSPRFGLTARELDVLRLIARGLSNRQIGTELYISGNTAGVHVSRILAKLGVATRTQAAALAHEHNLVL